MSEQFFNALVRTEPHTQGHLLSVVFTEEGGARVTPELFERFQNACCGEKVKLVSDSLGTRITGYTCDEDESLVISMWGIARLVHEVFGIETDVVFPKDMCRP